MDDKNTKKPQKFHTKNTPRIGGLAIIISALIGSLLLDNIIAIKLIVASLPIVIGGFLEDSSIKVKPIVRLILSFLSGSIAIILTGTVIKTIGFTPFNNIPYTVAFIFTTFSVAGVTNSLNIIDGFNGLASGFSLITLIIIALVLYQLKDTMLFKLTAIMFLSVSGFFILNFPFGKIFLGDSGAYFIGFMLAELSVLTVSRHHIISPWFCLVLMIYPVWEVIFSFYRRKILHSAPAMKPDKMHLHSIIARKITKSNPTTTLVILPFILMFNIAAYFARYKTSLNIIITLLFILFYIITYNIIVKHKKLIQY